MYQAHWGLSKPPFKGFLDPKSFYQSPTHEEALARLNFLVEQHRRLGLLVGPSGSGKSLLLEVFAQRLRRQHRSVARLSLLDVEPTEMLSLLAAEWELPIGSLQSAPVLWRALTNRLIEHRYQQLETVVLFDDVEQADRADVAARHAAGPVRSLARDAADNRVGRPPGMPREAGTISARTGRLADRRRAVAAGRHGAIRQHVAVAGRLSDAGLRRAGGRSSARACPRHPASRLPVGRPGFAGRGRSESRSDRCGGRRGGLSGVVCRGLRPAALVWRRHSAAIRVATSRPGRGRTSDQGIMSPLL